MSSPATLSKQPALVESTAKPKSGSRLSVTDAVLGVSFFVDTLVVVLALIFAHWLRFSSGWLDEIGLRPLTTPALKTYSSLIGLGAAMLIATFAYSGVYDPKILLKFQNIALRIWRAATFWLLAYLSVSLVLKFEPDISRLYVVSSYLSALVLLLGWRWLFTAYLRNSATLSKSMRQNILFVGWSQETERLCTFIEKDPTNPYKIIGCVLEENSKLQMAGGATILGEYSTHKDLEKYITQYSPEVLVLSRSEISNDQMIQFANTCEKHFVQFRFIPSYFQILLKGLSAESINGVPVLGISALPLDRTLNRCLKRGVDIIGALVGLTISAPLIALFGIMIYLESPGAIFYRQVRMGRNGRLFHIIKLRSMKLDAEKVGGAQWAKKNDDRRLRIGAFMRSTNIDEVPQFWNVLKGEMSLVGPRPERPELIVNFKEEIMHYNARHGSKPGITGWAQVNGLRGDTSLVERVKYDLYYMENWTFWWDFQIMFLTFVKRENAY